MLVSDIMTSVRDLVTVSADAQLQRFIAAAVREYNRWQPNLATTTIETVADQQVYDLPVGSTHTSGVREVVWHPGGSNAVIEDRLTANVSPDEVIHQGPASAYIDRLNAADREARARGGWEVQADATTGALQLWLYPIPTTAGLDVLVYYEIAHVVSGSGATLDYATIPDRHFEAVVKLSAVEVLQAEAAGRANQFDHKDGLSSVTKGHLPDNLLKMARQFRAEVQGMLR